MLAWHSGWRWNATPGNSKVVWITFCVLLPGLLDSELLFRAGGCVSPAASLWGDMNRPFNSLPNVEEPEDRTRLSNDLEVMKAWMIFSCILKVRIGCEDFCYICKMEKARLARTITLLDKGNAENHQQHKPVIKMLFLSLLTEITNVPGTVLGILLIRSQRDFFVTLPLWRLILSSVSNIVKIEIVWIPPPPESKLVGALWERMRKGVKEQEDCI